MRIEREERAGLAPARVEEAVRDFERHGFVVFEGCLDEAFVTELRDAYDVVLDAKISRSGIRPAEPDERRELRDRTHIDFRPTGGNHDYNRWNMHLPSRRPFLDERLVANPVATAVIERIVGPDVILKRIASDTPMPGAGYQTIHPDLHGDVPTPQLVLNVPLVDCTADNAPLEVWPHSHLDDPEAPDGPFPHVVRRLAREAVERRARTLASTTLTVPAGSMILRDTRTLHRGTPNRTGARRPMMSLSYRAPPYALPIRAVTDAAARIGLSLRERGREGGRIVLELLNGGNELGRRVEALAGTDRDYRRPIPADLWAELSPRARRLLRLAALESGAAASAEPEGASIPGSIPLAQSLLLAVPVAFGRLLRSRVRA